MTASGGSFTPINQLVSPLLTDKYQLTMCYAYFKNKTHEKPAVFDLFFRSAPFEGEFTIFAGLEECLRYVASFRFSADEIDFVRSQMPHAEAAFFEWLALVDCSAVKIYGIDEGSVVFPRVPLLRVEGPLAICQLLETTLLVLVNYASLMATNTIRHCLAAGAKSRVIEFGLRRAQGPDGGLSGARYAYMGGASGTSNMQAAKLLGIPASGTHAHSFVTSFTAEEDVRVRTLATPDGDVDFVALCKACLAELRFDRTNQHELFAFIAYALAFPDGFLALVDTYDTLESGVPNFLAVALALHRCGHRAVGIRLDSGDLAYLSKRARQMFADTERRLGNADALRFAAFTIVASNDLSEPTLRSLSEQGHAIDVFGIGTHLITCKAQPALGCVYKLVVVGDKARIKLSEDAAKLTLPARKNAYRLHGATCPLVDLLQQSDETPPVAGERLLCVHPTLGHKRAYVTPVRVERLLHLYWCGAAVDASADELADAASEPHCSEVQGDTRAAQVARAGIAAFALGNDESENRTGVRDEPLPKTAAGRVTRRLPSLAEARERCLRQVAAQREDHVRALNPTPYKVSVTQSLHDFIKVLWGDEAPIHVLS